MVPSAETVPPLPVIGTISSSNLPALAAVAARWCEVTANSSCFTRAIWYFFARFSAVSPIEM
jgi:hypothetical protein